MTFILRLGATSNAANCYSSSWHRAGCPRDTTGQALGQPGPPGPQLGARTANARCDRAPTAAAARRTPALPTRLTLRKCHEFETDLGVVAVRQRGKPWSHMIDMSCAVRSYTCVVDEVAELCRLTVARD